MFPTWRLRLREARVAWQSGRYDEAGALAHRRVAPRLSAGQAACHATWRARLSSGPASASLTAIRRPAGDDLATADRLGGQAEAIAQPASAVCRTTCSSEVQRYLAAGQTAPALRELEKLHRRGLGDERERACCGRSPN